MALCVYQGGRSCLVWSGGYYVWRRAFALGPKCVCLGNCRRNPIGFLLTAHQHAGCTSRDEAILSLGKVGAFGAWSGCVQLMDGVGAVCVHANRAAARAASGRRPTESSSLPLFSQQDMSAPPRLQLLSRQPWSTTRDTLTIDGFA
jgi:hypothetical protein